MKKPIILKILGVLIIIGAVLFAIGTLPLLLQWGKGGHQAHPFTLLVDLYFVICGIGIIALRKWAIIAFAIPVAFFSVYTIIVLFIEGTGESPLLAFFVALLLLLIPLGIVVMLFLHWDKCVWLKYSKRYDHNNINDKQDQI